MQGYKCDANVCNTFSRDAANWYFLEINTPTKLSYMRKQFCSPEHLVHYIEAEVLEPKGTQNAKIN